ncbi:Protein R02D5.6 d [Aphelenchoides avenae]|nr:Protein R02D5.6 d [Aphelenchus avenae]
MDLFFTPIPLVQDEFDPGSYGNTLFMCILYVSLGTVAIAANLLNIVVFWTNKELRTNYVFIIALDIGEIINGLSYILTGLGRGTQLLLGNYHRPITVHDCFFTRYWPVPLVLGTEIPALIMLVVSMERVYAVHRPGLYNRYFTLRLKVTVVVLMVLVQLGILAWAAFSAYGNTLETSTQHCAIISSTSTAFSTFHFSFVVLAYVFSFFCLAVIYLVHRNVWKNIRGSTKTKRKQISVFLVMTAVDICLVSMPSFVMISAKWGLFQPNDIVVSLTYSTTGFMSLCHTVVNVFCHSEFRRQLKYFAKLMLPQRHAHLITVTPVIVTPSMMASSSANPEIPKGRSASWSK